MDLLPKVFRTEGDVTEFDPSKIMVSLIKETGMNEATAKEITELTVRRIISSGIKFLSGPHIREIICSILSEQHFEDQRKLYTRIGMPLMDYEAILEQGVNENSNQDMNPESIHHWAANRISSEYALLKILNTEESKAHLFGDIYIHKLKYFDLRPMSQLWDPRLILKGGIPPSTDFLDFCRSGPAENFGDAVIHLAKWLGITQAEFSGPQGLNFITTFLAPYAKGLTDDDIKKQLLKFFYDLNQLKLIIGRNIPEISISCCPPVIDDFKDTPALYLKGEYRGAYEDYNDESCKIFNAITEIVKKGDSERKAFDYPKQVIFLTDRWLKDYDRMYTAVCEGIGKKSPVFVNLSSTWLQKDSEIKTSNVDFTNRGTLQVISLNLPRCAYISKDESSFSETIFSEMQMCFTILRKKYDIIENSKHLPMCSSTINGEQLLKLENQELSIGIVGLNEAVKHLTNYELHESTDSLAFGKKVLLEMEDICKESSKRENKKYSLVESTSKLVNYRFAKLNRKHFPKVAIPQTNEKGYIYTSSTHFGESADISLTELIKKRDEFYSILRWRAKEEIPLKRVKKEYPNLTSFLKDICQDTNIVSFEFVA